LASALVGLQEANERSFKTLQEYLALARGDGAESVGPQRGFKFDFYMRQERAGGGESTSDRDDIVERVQLMLPPPGRRPPSQQEGEHPWNPATFTYNSTTC
jgi:hypothetical protein